MPADTQKLEADQTTELGDNGLESCEPLDGQGDSFDQIWLMEQESFFDLVSREHGDGGVGEQEDLARAGRRIPLNVGEDDGKSAGEIHAEIVMVIESQVVDQRLSKSPVSVLE